MQKFQCLLFVLQRSYVYNNIIFMTLPLIFMQQICISLSNGNTISKLTLNEAKKCKISLGMTPRPGAVFGRNHTCLPGHCFAHFFKRAIIFSHSFFNADCFTSGIGRIHFKFLL